MALFVDGIQAEQFARNVEAGDLHAAIIGGNIGFDRSAADGVNAGKRFADAVEHLSALEQAFSFYIAVEQRRVRAVQPHRQAKLVKAAVLAGYRSTARLLYSLMRHSHSTRIKTLLRSFIDEAQQPMFRCSAPEHWKIYLKQGFQPQDFAYPLTRQALLGVTWRKCPSARLKRSPSPRFARGRWCIAPHSISIMRTSTLCS